MTERFVTRGFVGRSGQQGSGQADAASRTPPGQYLTTDFPVLSAGPTPRTPLDRWSFSIEGLVRERVSWTWDEFLALPSREWTVDISCVTKWTKLDMHWRGVSVDTLFEHVDLDPGAAFAIGWSDGGYNTNLPVGDILNGQAFVAFEYDGRPLAPEHGGPARLVVPGRYFWKSAKWLRGLRLQAQDEPGFWESLGYHNRGDQWLEERYSGD
jgi:DMSO/TMAO reductase YedYZ molybdopterin-dependent catalytic subunit